MNKQQISCVILVILLLSTSSCNLLLPMPTEVSPTPESRTVTGSGQSNSDGQVRFQDAPHAWELTVTLEDKQTGQPVQGIEAWFASNGSEVLIVLHDPSDLYPDTVRELLYAGLSLRSPAGGKGAAPSQPVSVTETLSLVKAADLYQSFGKWAAFLADFPDIEKWGRESEQLCITPKQAGQGLGLTSNVVPGFVSRNTLGAPEVQRALIEVYDAGKGQAASNLLDGYAATQNRTNLQLTVFSIQDGFPPFVRIDGFCSIPLERQDPQSVLG